MVFLKTETINSFEEDEIVSRDGHRDIEIGVEPLLIYVFM